MEKISQLTSNLLAMVKKGHIVEVAEISIQSSVTCLLSKLQVFVLPVSTLR